MADGTEWVASGGVTTPLGFSAAATYAGVKSYGSLQVTAEDPSANRLDLGVLVADRPCNVAGVFTKNRVYGAPVAVTRERVQRGLGQALIVNSGCANVATGAAGLADAQVMCELAAKQLGIDASLVTVGSTGVIGRRLPMESIAAAIPRLQPHREGGAEFARAIMTTDTVPKSRAIRVCSGGHTYCIGGAAKGSGMVHPDMATVFGFFTTDAELPADRLQALLREAADVSFNMIDVDMDTSTSDMMLLFANAAAGGGMIAPHSPEEAAFCRALSQLAIELARDLARDGEGAHTLIEMEVVGAASLADARRAARTVVSSPLVKTMVTGRDPNLGRVMMALGRSGVDLSVDQISVWIGGQCAFERGSATALDYAEISRAMDTAEVKLKADLGQGAHTAKAWGCDLTEDYIRINADYTT